MPTTTRSRTVSRGVSSVASGRNRSDQVEQPALLEHLEPRSLLSAPYDFAAVGVRYDNGPAVFLVNGVVAGDDSITGTVRSVTFGGTAADAPIDWTHLNRGDRGSFTFDTRNGFTPYGSQQGTQFIADERWLMGSFVGRDADGKARDQAVLGQVLQASQFPQSFGDAFQMQMMRLTATGVEVGTLTINFDGLTDADFHYHFDSTGDQTVTRHVTGYANGRATFDTGEVMVLMGDRAGAVIADLDSSDGIVGVATGRTPNFNGVPLFQGWSRGEIVTTGPRSAAFFGVDPSEINAQGVGVADIAIELTYSSTAGVPSTFRLFRADQWQAGDRSSPLATGTWRTQNGLGPVGQTPQSYELTATTGDKFVVRTTANTRQLFVTTFTASDSTEEQLWGVVSRQEARPEAAAEFLVGVDPHGHPIVYQQSFLGNDVTNTSVFTFDLILEAGGEPVVGEPIIWHDFAATFVTGLSASGHVQVWQTNLDSWLYTDLTATLTSAHLITGELFSTRYDTSEDKVDKEQFLAGFDDQGKFVVYHQAFPNGTWTFIDAERDGLEGANGPAAIPAGLSRLAGWGSGWNAAHFAGIDDSGELWSIWWAPGQTHWRVDSLTAASGGPVLTGDPTAIVTNWNSFHISAVDANGHLISTWWAVANNQWLSQDLTAGLSGPTLDAHSLASNFSSHRSNINITGLDSSGQARVYWWSIAGGWQIDTLSSGVAMADIPSHPWHMTSALWVVSAPLTVDSQSLLGHDSDGHLVRLTWRSDRGQAWALEDLTMLGVPYYT